jgi:hypothetical protein
VTQNRDSLRVVVNTVMNLRILVKDSFSWNSVGSYSVHRCFIYHSLLLFHG